MNCIECGGDTKVVDRRGVRRRRECLACGTRFSTEEVLTVKAVKAEPVKVDKPAPAPKPKQTSVAALKKAASARRKIEERRDKLFSDSWDEFFEDDTGSVRTLLERKRHVHE